MAEPIILGVSGYKQSGKSSLCDYISAWWDVERTNSLLVQPMYWVEQDDKGKVFINGHGSHPEPWKANAADREVGIYSFADPLKEFCVNVLNIKHCQCYGTDDEKNTPTEYLWQNMPNNIRMAYSKEKVKRKTIRSISTHLPNGITWDEFDEPVPRAGPMTGREIMQVFGTDIMRKFFSDMIWVNGTISKIRRDKFPLALIADVRFVSEVNAVLNEPNGYIIRLTRKVDNADKHPSEIELDNYDWGRLGDRCLLIDNTNQEIGYKNDLAVQFLNRIIRNNNGRHSG